MLFKIQVVIAVLPSTVAVQTSIHQLLVQIMKAADALLQNTVVVQMVLRKLKERSSKAAKMFLKTSKVLNSVFLVFSFLLISFMLQSTAIWIKTEDLAEITQYGGTSTWRTVVVPGSGMEVVKATRIALRPKRNVKEFVLNQLKKVKRFVVVCQV